MGLISWIKNKHYDNKLARANKQVAKANYPEAEEMFLSLLGKQSQAVVDLASLYVKRASDVQSQIDALNKIVALNQYVNEDNKTGYNVVLSNYLNTLETKAATLFKDEHYANAVMLIDALRPHLRTTAFDKKVSQYHAYYAFSQSLVMPDYEQKLSVVVRNLKQYEKDCLNDILYFIQHYELKHQYVRAISLISPFLSTFPTLKDTAIKFIVQVVEGKDFDKSNYIKITEFVTDLELSQDAATELVRLSNEEADKKNYKLSVLYDSFAAEFFANDNRFNFNRCIHIAEDIRLRNATNEVNALFSFANQQKLTAQQIATLKEIIKAMIASIVSNHATFIKAETHAKDFATALITLDDIDYLLTTCYQLYNAGCNLIKPFLVQQKKKFIKSQIEQQNYERAEAGAKSMIGIDEEAETLIAETYYAESMQADDAEAQLRIYFQIVKLVDTEKVLSSFDSKKDKILSELAQLAKTEYEQGNTEQAYVILDIISRQTRYWLELYIALRTEDNKKLNTLTRQIKHLEESLQVLIENVPDLSIYETQYLHDFWTYYKSLIQKKAQSQPKDKAIDNLKQLREKLQQYLHTNLNSTLVSEITLQLVKLEWMLACELEAEQDYDKAITLYEDAKAENIAAYTGRSELRLLICYVKADKMNETLRDRAKTALLSIKSHEKLKEDLAYRLGLHLLKLMRADEAEHLFTTYLGEHNAELIKLCQIVRIQRANSIVEGFNNNLKRIENNTMSASEAENFISNIGHSPDYYDAEKTLGKKDLFGSYTSLIKNYILKKNFDEENYVAVVNDLFQETSCLNDIVAFRNLATAALGAIENKQANGHIELYISLILTAIYTDSLFIKSLEHTSWDDPYTFTLRDCFGGTDTSDYDDIPDNINDDVPTDKNISIREVQKTLLTRLEIAVRENYSDFETFLNEQKTALDTLVELKLDQSCTIICPYLAHDNREAWNSVKTAFDYELQQNYGNEERVIALGVEYGFTDEIYQKYKEAKTKAEQCKQTLKGNLTSIKTTFQHTKLSSVREYDELFASLKAAVSSDMNNAIHAKADYRQFIDKYEVICKAVNESSLSFAFAQYANGEIVHRLNDETMKLRDGALLLTRIYLIAPSSVQVKENLQGVLRNLLQEIEEHGYQADKTALANIQSIANSTIKSFIDDAQIQAQLSVIVDKVNANKMSKYDALKKVYALYNQKSSDKRICENLVTLCDMCIMEYIVQDDYKSSSVETILDQLNNNKSNMFNICATKLANEYRKIWNQLPLQTQMLIQQGYTYTGSTLNSKGLALKKGLGYYKKLGNITDTDSISSLFGRLGRRPF